VRAITLSSFDGLDAATLGDVPEPTAGDDDVLVAVEAAGVGPWDVQTCSGAFAPAGGLSTFPQTLGWDFAGTVQSASDQSGFKAGDRVLGFSAQPWTTIGTFAERIAVPAGLLARWPDDLDAGNAGALSVTALTGDLAVSTAEVSDRDVVLVIGAAGAVGGVATQLAAARGAKVIALVTSPQQQATAQHYGAADAVDANDDAPARLRDVAPDGVDVIIDTVGPRAWKDVVGSAARGGRFVTTIPSELPSPDLGLTATTLQVQPDPARLAELANHAAAGSLRVTIAETYDLADAITALQRVAGGGAGGKVVINVSG
jgi:NADPH:quinone reductase-like Zn-dependent oxidoreductase